MKQVHLIDNQQFNEVKVGSFPLFPSDNIPFLRSRHNDLRVVYLLPCEMGVTGKFPYLDFIMLKSPLEISYDLRDKRFHGSNVNYFEV